MAFILVVDDRRPNFEVLEAILTHAGHTLEWASDGEAAWQKICERLPDLVITDLVMPNLSGEDLIRRMRKDRRAASLPVMIHTASYRSRSARSIAEGLDVRWILPKPCEPKDLMAMVSDALGQPIVAAAPAQHASGPAPAAAAANRQDPALMQRFDSMVSLGLGLASERDPKGLVDLFSETAQRVFGANYVGVVLVAADGSLRAFGARGLPPEVERAVAEQVADCPAAQALLHRPDGPGMLLASRPGDFTGLPMAHPPIASFMACRVAARESTVGWMWVADHQDGQPFPVEDERLLLALAAVLGSFYRSQLAMEQLDKRVAERTTELEAANAELEAFSFLVSHDLRAPLANIGGLVKMLQHMHGASLPPSGVHVLDRIGVNVAALTTLIESLLHFARMSRQPMRLQPVRLDNIARDSLEAHAGEIDIRRIDIRLQPLPDCRGDPALLGQVFANLVGNAVKYTRNHSEPVIEIGAREIAGELLIYVRDNGAGFDTTSAEGLFTPFKRFHEASQFEGSGVGLAIVKQIVARHGGRVWAESRPGEGACFTFTLPVAH